MKSTPVFDRTIQLIEDRLNLVSQSHKLVSSNLSNASTPGYVAKQLTFQQALRDSLQEQPLHLAKSDSRHLAPEGAPSSTIPAEVEETGPVSMEQEMMKLARNSVEYQFMVTMLNKKFTMIRQAIGEGGN